MDLNEIGAILTFSFEQVCILSITFILICNKLQINSLIWHESDDLY